MPKSSAPPSILLMIALTTSLYAAICILLNEKYAILMPLVFLLSQIWLISSLKPISVIDFLSKVGVTRTLASCALVIFISFAARKENVTILAANSPAFFMFFLAVIAATFKPSRAVDQRDQRH